MNLLIAIFIGLISLLASLVVTAQSPHQEGLDAGRAANTATPGRVSATSATAVVPNYGLTPSEIGLTADTITTANQERVRLCRTRPNDPSCQAILGAQQSAANPRQVISTQDSSVAAARAVANDPYRLVSNLSTSYGACVPTTSLVSPAIYDKQSCHTYYLREPDQPCLKTLTVKVDFSCGVGFTGPVETGGNTPTCRNILTGVVLDAKATERDLWDNQCAGYEARVPQGLLPPDGTNVAVIGTGINDFVNKCERKASICLEGDVTKRIDGRDVYRACWQYQNLFDCVSNNVVSDCEQARTGQCSAAGAPTCTDYDMFFQTPFCTAYRSEFQCLIRDAVTRPSTSCAGQQYCVAGNCFDASHQNDGDFARSVALLEANRQAGKYLEPANMRLFKGFDNRCVKKLFGLINCCNRGGTGAGAAFANMAVLLASGRAIGSLASSTYTYDALFASDAPNFVINGFQSLFGTGGSSAAAGLLAGDLSVSSFMSSLVPGPWTVALLAIQYSGLLSCPEKEKVVAMKRDANLCVDLGSYCSKRLPVIRTCMEQTNSFCCFNSKLARILNVAGKAQMGRSLGTAQNPNCDGFSVEEFQQLDFSRIDLSEFYADIVPKTPDMNALTERIRQTTGNCAANGGRCGP
jgi:conjugal transfer mating pair stabilization protein TraN